MFLKDTGFRGDDFGGDAVVRDSERLSCGFVDPYARVAAIRLDIHPISSYRYDRAIGEVV